MRRLSEERPPRVLMSCDAVGGVWRYSVDLAAALEGEGIETVLAVCGPPPSLQQRMEVSASRLVELDAPLDWMSESEDEVARVPRLLDELAADLDVDLVHVNLPSQAAGLKTSLPVVAVTHSCCVTWFAAVRGQPVPPGWQWHERLNRRGFERADAIVAPSGSHAALSQSSYGNLPAFCVIPNGSGVITGADSSKDRCVFAAGRWWDDGKNAEVLDRAAPLIRWPLVLAGAVEGPNGQKVDIRNVLQRGNLPHPQLMELMQRAAVFVSPSIYEPFGLAALEAALAGCALVLADIPTYRELWQDAALFFDPRDAQSLARAVNTVSLDDRLRAELSAAARRRAEIYSLERQARRFARLYRKIGLSAPLSLANVEAS